MFNDPKNKTDIQNKYVITVLLLNVQTNSKIRTCNKIIETGRYISCHSMT